MKYTLKFQLNVPVANLKFSFQPGDKLDHPRTLHVEHHHSRVSRSSDQSLSTSRNSNCVADNEMDIEALDHDFDIRLVVSQRLCWF